MSDSKKPNKEQGSNKNNMEYHSSDMFDDNFDDDKSLFSVSDNMEDEYIRKTEDLDDALTYAPDGFPVDHTHDDAYESFDNSVDYNPINSSFPKNKEIKAPDDDLEFYESYMEGVDPDALDEHIVKPKDHSDESAKLFANLYGVGGVIRENASLIRGNKSKTIQLLMSMTCNLVFAFIIFSMMAAFASYPKTRYIPTSDNSAICEVTPENNPNITDVAIADFAKDAIINLYTFDYVNHEDQINANLSRWFTPQGRIDTINAMNTAGILSFVKDNALTLRAGTTAAARIERKGRTSDGKPYWVVRFPMVVDVYSGAPNPEDTQRYTVTVRIVADTASAQNPKGLGVASAALEPKG